MATFEVRPKAQPVVEAVTETPQHVYEPNFDKEKASCLDGLVSGIRQFRDNKPASEIDDYTMQYNALKKLLGKYGFKLK